MKKIRINDKRIVTDSCCIFDAIALYEAFEKGSVYINRRHSVSNYDELRALHVVYEDLLEHRDSIINKDEIPVYEATLEEVNRLLEIIHQDLRDTFPRRSAIFHDCSDPVELPVKNQKGKERIIIAGLLALIIGVIIYIIIK